MDDETRITLEAAEMLLNDARENYEESFKRLKETNETIDSIRKGLVRDVMKKRLISLLNRLTGETTKEIEQLKHQIESMRSQHSAAVELLEHRILMSGIAAAAAHRRAEKAELKVQELGGF